MSSPKFKKPIIQRFGQKLHALRISHKMTLKELAISLDLNAHGYISEIEAGKKMPTVEFVVKTAQLFNVSTDELLIDAIDLAKDNS